MRVFELKVKAAARMCHKLINKDRSITEHKYISLLYHGVHILYEAETPQKAGKDLNG